MARTLAVSSPLSAGDIVGRSFRIFRQHILLIAKILLLPTIFLCLGRIGIVVGSTYGFKFVNNPGRGMAWFALAAAGGIIGLVGLTVLWIRQLALIRLLTGFATTYEEARQHVKGRIFSMIILFIVFIMAISVVSGIFAILMALTVPNLRGAGLMPWIGSFCLAASIIGLLLSIIFFSLVFQLVSAALALGTSELGALIGECFSLTLLSFWRSIGFLFMTVTAVTLAAYPFQLPIILLVVLVMVAQGAISGNAEASNIPIAIQIFNAVWEAAINMFIGPIYYLCYGLYYCDLRMRQEGLDLVDRIDQVQRDTNMGKLSSHGI